MAKRFEAKTVVLLTIPILALLVFSWGRSRLEPSPQSERHGKMVLEGLLLSRPWPTPNPTPPAFYKRRTFFEDTGLQHDVIGFGVKFHRFQEKPMWDIWDRARTPRTHAKCYGIKVFEAATGEEIAPLLTSNRGQYFEIRFYKASEIRKCPQGVMVKAPVGWSFRGKSHFEPLQLRLSASAIKALPEGPRML